MIREMGLRGNFRGSTRTDHRLNGIEARLRRDFRMAKSGGLDCGRNAALVSRVFCLFSVIIDLTIRMVVV